MTKRIVVALGGNAILTDDPSAEAQQTALQQTAKYLVNFLEMGDVQLVVPSPKPISIMEADAIRTLAQEGVTLIAAGGGGVPVVRKDNDITGVEAVIDKDFTAAKLAELVDADELVILTAVQYVTKDFTKPTQEDIKQATVAEMQALVDEGQFPAGSMKPKVEAAMSFVTATGRNAVITSLDNIAAYLENGDGTVITA